MAEFEEHPSKPATWLADRMVVHPEAEHADCTVWAAVQPPAPAGLRWEGLLARCGGPDRATVCSVPFWLYGVHLGDEVSLTTSAEGAPVVAGIAQRSGNRTFRVVFEQANSDDGRWRELMVAMERNACWFDVRGPSYMAIAAVPGQADSVADDLAQRESRGELRYESGQPN